MKYKLKDEYKDYKIQIEVPIIGVYPFAAAKVNDDEGVEYWTARGFGHLWELIEQKEEVKLPIEDKKETTPKKKGRKPKQK